MGIQVAARSKAWVCGSSIAGVARSNPARSMEVCRECCVLSGGGFCEGLITRPEESFRMWCVYLWLWSLDYEEALAHWGLSRHEKISVYVSGTTRIAWEERLCHSYTTLLLLLRSFPFPGNHQN